MKYLLAFFYSSLPQLLKQKNLNSLKSLGLMPVPQATLSSTSWNTKMLKFSNSEVAPPLHDSANIPIVSPPLSTPNTSLNL